TVRWLFLTLTVRNVYDGTELNKSLSDMSKGFNRMMKYKKINKNLVGFMRATEVTVNNIDNSYNQHMHVLVCVESTYFYNTEINKNLSELVKGFKCMNKYKKINKKLVGFNRATEVTVNYIDNSFNQHMHLLVCVESTYFYNTENYVNQKQWIQFWKRAMKLDYDPNVKVQMIRPKNKHK